MASPSPRSRRTAPRRAYTLVELVVSAAITAVLMTGLTSAVLLASRALPDADRPADEVNRQSEVAAQLCGELQYAQHITERAVRAVTFTVADRNGDGSPERIRYAWSGTAGAPLTRQYNGGTAVSVLEDIRQFELLYDLKSVTEQFSGPVVESAEAELRSHDSIFNLSDAHVHDNSWWAEYFKPSLPPEALSWKVARVRFLARRDHDVDTTTTIQLCLPTPAFLPSTTVVDSTTMPQLSLSNVYQWVEKSFGNAGGLAPGTGLCLTFTTAAATSCQLRYRGSGVTLSDAGLIEGNPTWQVLVPDKALLFYVYGRYTTPGPPKTATRQYVTGIRLGLQAGTDTAARLDTAARTLNAPEVLTAVWEADFDTNPTVLDMNADGTGDWLRHDGQAFNLATLVNGIWLADTQLDTRPDNDFAALTTCELRFRCTQTGGNGTVFSINADRSGGTVATILACLNLVANNTQTLTVYAKRDNVTRVTLVTVAGLSTGFSVVRLLIDPVANTVNVHLDGADKGTFPYSTYVPAGSDRYASVYPGASSGEFDYVRIRVGGTSP